MRKDLLKFDLEENKRCYQTAANRTQTQTGIQSCKQQLKADLKVLLQINHHNLLRSLLFNVCTRIIINTGANNHTGVSVHSFPPPNPAKFHLTYGKAGVGNILLFWLVSRKITIGLCLNYAYLHALQLPYKPRLHFKISNKPFAFFLLLHNQQSCHSSPLEKQSIVH